MTVLLVGDFSAIYSQKLVLIWLALASARSGIELVLASMLTPTINMISSYLQISENTPAKIRLYSVRRLEFITTRSKKREDGGLRRRKGRRRSS